MAEFLSRLEWIKDKGKGDTQPIENWKTINIRMSSEMKNNMMTINVENDFANVSQADTTPRIYNKGLGELSFEIDDKFKFYSKYDNNNT